jgi:hypothetical protein
MMGIQQESVGHEQELSFMCVFEHVANVTMCDMAQPMITTTINKPQ